MSLKIKEKVMYRVPEKKEDGFIYSAYDVTMYGYVDEKDEWVIEPKYYTATEFSEGLALVSTDSKPKKRFYINENDETVIDISDWKVDKAGPFHNGLALVRNERSAKFAIIDKRGKFLSDFEFVEVGDSNISKLKTLCTVVEREGAKALNWASPELMVSNESMKLIKKAIRNHILLGYNGVELEGKQLTAFVMEQKETMLRLREFKLLNICAEIQGGPSDKIEKLLG